MTTVEQRKEELQAWLAKASDQAVMNQLNRAMGGWNRRMIWAEAKKRNLVRN